MLKYSDNNAILDSPLFVSNRKDHFCFELSDILPSNILGLTSC